MTWVRADTGGQAGWEDTSPVLRITEFTDAGCPWAWGSEPAFRLLRQILGPRAEWRRVFGILFDEDDDPAPDPDAEARWYQRFIDDVTVHTGAPYAPRLLRHLGSARARDAVRADWAETRRPIFEVLDLDAPGPHGGRAKEVGERRRYALPTFLLDGPFAVYLDAARAAAGDAVLPDPVRLAAGEALERWRSLTGTELALLAGVSDDPSDPPGGAVRIDGQRSAVAASR